MPQWVKVLAGSLALMVGASAPSLILLTLNPSHFIPPRLTPSVPPILEAPRQGANTKSGQERDEHEEEETVWHRATHDPVAIVTLLLAMATAILAGATWRAASDTRRALFLAQRPRVRVRNIVIRPPQVPGYFPMLFHPNHTIDGQLYIVNVGGTAARLVEVHCEIYWPDAGVMTLPMERPYEGQNPSAPNLRTKLQPGQSWPLTFGSYSMIGGTESDQILAGHRMIYVLGYVAYRDELGIERRTAFCRKYDHIRRRFFMVDDPDYEHEE
jgi:hypothetical protein